MEELLGGILGKTIIAVVTLVGGLVCEFVWKKSEEAKHKIKNEYLHTFYVMVEEEVMQGSQVLKGKYKELSADGDISREDKIILQATIKEEVVRSVKDLIAKLPKFVKNSVFGKADEEIHKAASRVVEAEVRKQKVQLPVNLR